MRIRIQTTSLAAAAILALAATAPSWGASNSANRNASHNGAACANTQSANSPSLNSRAATCTTGLTVKFVGEANTTDGVSYAYKSWVDFDGLTVAPLTSKFCESGSTTNCVTFNVGDAAGTTQTLTLTGPSKNIDITARHLCEIDVWTGSAPTAAVADAGSPNTNAAQAFRNDMPLFTVSGTTTSTWSNGDTLFWTDNTYCE